MAPRSQVKRTSNYFYDAFYFAENLKSTSVPLEFSSRLVLFHSKILQVFCLLCSTMAVASPRNHAPAPTSSLSTAGHEVPSSTIPPTTAKRSRDSTTFDFLRLPVDLQSLVLVAPAVDPLEPTSTKHEQPPSGKLPHVLASSMSPHSNTRRAAPGGIGGSWLGYAPHLPINK